MSRSSPTELSAPSIQSGKRYINKAGPGGLHASCIPVIYPEIYSEGRSEIIAKNNRIVFVSLNPGLNPDCRTRIIPEKPIVEFPAPQSYRRPFAISTASCVSHETV